MTIRVCSFESRRRPEMQALLEKRGADATVVESMQELPLELNEDVRAFLADLSAGRIDLVLFMTGVGAEALYELAGREIGEEAFLNSLSSATLMVRGPKPLVVLRKWGAEVTLRVPAPNTWREALELLDKDFPVANRRIAVQEYGVPNRRLYAAIEERGGFVIPVPVYRWGLPDDVAPLQQTIQTATQTGFDLYMFTSANQLVTVLKVADEMGLGREFRTALKNGRIASIGPTCSEALVDHGFEVAVEANPPKMGHLVAQSLAEV